MAIDPLPSPVANGDVVTDKVDELVVGANVQADKVATLEVRGVTARYARPGDEDFSWSSTLTGPAKERPLGTVGLSVNNADMGASLRIRGEDVPPGPGYLDVGLRTDFAVEEGRTYAVTYVLARSTDPTDPVGHGVETRIQNLSAGKVHVSNARLGDVLSPTVAGGVIALTFLIGKPGAPGTLAYTIPPTSRYIVPYVRIYGNGQETDLAVIGRIEDVTDKIVGGADIAGILTRVTSVEGSVAGKADTTALAAETAAREGAVAALSGEVAGLAADVAGVVEIADNIPIKQTPPPLLGVRDKMGFPIAKIGANYLSQPKLWKVRPGKGLRVFDKYGFRWPLGGGSTPTPTLTTYPTAYGHWRDNDVMSRVWSDDVIMGFIYFGQSYEKFRNNSAAPGGAETVIHGTPIQPGYALMPNIGLHVDGNAFSSFVDLYEQQLPDVPLASSESPCSMFSNSVLTYMQTAFGFKRQMVCLSVADVGQPWRVFMKGSTFFGHFENALRNCKAAAEARGKRFVLGAVISSQGQSDGVPHIEERVQRDMRWQFMIEEAARRILGQSDEVALVLRGADRAYGWNRLAPMDAAHIEACRRSPGRILLAGPGYPHRGGGEHPVNEGYMTLGLADADAVNRGLLGAKFIPVVADSLEWLSATQCRINFSMDSARQLVLDDGTGPVTATGIETSKGIFCRDATDAYAADIPVTSVTVGSSGFTASPNQSIYVTLGRAVNQQDFLLGYANWQTDVTLNGNTKARGLIRDDFPGETATGLSYQHHRWAMPFMFNAFKRF